MKGQKYEISLFRYIIVFGKMYLLAEMDVFSHVCKAKDLTRMAKMNGMYARQCYRSNIVEMDQCFTSVFVYQLK